MIDKLNLQVPRSFTFKSSFGRAWNSAANDSIFKKQYGGMFEVTGDLRGIGLPLRLSCGHRFHPGLGPKVEVLGAGSLGFSDWNGVVSEVFDGDSYSCEVTRIDATADWDGVPVDDFASQVRVKFKATNQSFGELASFREVTRHGAQTWIAGVGSRQITFYDKTAHRRMKLLPAIQRGQRNRGERVSTFEDVYDYSPEKIITRLERRMGGREPEVLGIHLLGDIPKLMKCDPFTQLVFPSELKSSALTLNTLTPMDRITVLLLREKVRSCGLAWVKSWMRSQYTNADSLRRQWSRWEHLIVTGDPIPTRQQLTAQFHRTLQVQLAA